MYATQTLDSVFGALAHGIRREIITQLSKRDHSVLELAERFAVSQPAVTKHLNVLERAGLVRRRKEGRFHLCQLNPDRMQVASEWVETTRQYWTENFEALDEYLKELKNFKDETEKKS